MTLAKIEAKKAFAAEDCSLRVARNMLRNAAPMSMTDAVGDMISFKRKQGSDGVAERMWSSPARII